MENKPQEIKGEIASILNEIRYAEEPGSILYSGDETLKKGENYFLGANPGGHSDENVGNFADTISNQLYRKNSSSSFNEYFDASWKPGNKIYSKGMAPLQRRIKYLFNAIGIDLRNTLSTNLNFVRSSTLEKFHLDWSDAAEQCWKIHLLLLSVVQPKNIIVFGDDAFNFFKNKMSVNASEDFPVSSVKETKYCSCTKGSLEVYGMKLEIALIKVPHLSRFKIDARGIDYGDKYDCREALNWINGKIEKAA